MKAKRLLSSALGAAVLLSSVSFLSGCATLQEFFTGQKFDEEPVQQSMTNREWLSMINDAYGTDSSEEDLVEDAKEWGIIGEDEEIDLDAPADDQFVASTLARAAGYADTESSYEEIKRAVEEHGLNSVEALSDPQNAQNALEKVQEDMVHPRFEDRREIQLADNVIDLSSRLNVKDIKMTGDTVTLPLNIADGLDMFSVIILPGEKYGDEAAYKVKTIIDNGDDTADVRCIPAGLCEVYKSVNVSGHFPVDLNDFVAADSGNVTVQKSGAIAGKFTGYSREKLMSEKNDSINFTAQLYDNCTVSVSVKDIILNAKIDWSANDAGSPDIKRVFLSADYISDVDIEYTGDENAEQDKAAAAIGMSFPESMEIGRVPVHVCSGLTLYLDLSLTANAAGDLSVKVKTGETNGFEMKGVRFRTVNSVLDLADIRAERHSWAYTTVNIAVGMDYLLNNEEFLSLDMTSGPDVSGEATLHNASGENDEKLLCLDVSGFMKVLMNVNFSDAVSSGNGLDPSMKLLDLDESRSRIKWEGIHYENGKQVAECSYKEKTDKKESEESTTLPKGIFSLKTTYISVNEGESAAIGIKSLPSGYSEEDIIWKSLNPSVASVDAHGNITAVSGGTTGISASTKDGKYTGSCAVIVKAK